MRKLLRITFLASVLWNGVILLISPMVLQGYALIDIRIGLTFVLILIHNIFNALFYPLSGALSNGLRAAGDVKFTMYVSIFSTIVCRVVFSVIFGIWMDMGVIGVALAMCLDWGLRALLFWIRFKNGKWKEFQVIAEKGVANFYPAILANLCENVEVIPAVNQVELHPFFTQEAALENMKAYGVVPQAWGPLAEGKHGIFTDPELTEIGRKYGKSAAQVVLRWNAQRGYPSSLNPFMWSGWSRI